MNAADLALASGYTHVQTAGGRIPLQLFFLRDALGMQYDAERSMILSPPRPASDFEVSEWERRGNAPVIGLQARDQWPLLKGAAS